MKKEINNKKGFTLVELLATVLLISIILGVGGYFIINTINNSKQKSQTLSLANVKTSARIYVEENPNEVIWTESANEFYSCVKIKTLINKNLIKEPSTTDDSTISVNDYVMITKDKSGNIISETIDKNKTTICKTANNYIEIPTEENNCNTSLTYTPTVENQLLTKNENENFTFSNNKQKNAGSYKITATLKAGYFWEDGKTEDKYITCKINKAVPELTLSETGTDLATLNMAAENDEQLTTELKSNVDGIITIKSSNSNYVTAKPTDDNNTITANEEKSITIKPLSTRISTDTIITITITPTDTTNYYTKSTTYTISNISKKQAIIPTDDTKCLKNIYYNRGNQKLTQDPDEGYTFINNYQTEIGTYEITAKLKYGYIWNDGTNGIQTFNCNIVAPVVKATYVTNGGTTCDATTHTYNQKYGTLCTTTKTGYTFDNWYLGETTKIITPEKNVEEIEDHTLSANWTANSYTIKYDCNGGNGSIADSSHTYDTAKNLTANTCTRTGYIFNGWNTKADGTGDSYNDKQSVSNLSSQNGDNITLYAKWKVNTYTVTYNSGNIIYGLNNISTRTADRMKFSISNGTVTVTATNNDGYGYTTGRVYLLAGNTYTFSATTNAPTWGNDVEAFLMLNGTTNTYYHMAGNNNYTFTPSTTGTYWLRLDVNISGKTYTFSNISISIVIDSYTSSVNVGDSVDLTKTIDKQGLVFKGWNTTINATNALSSYQMPSNDVTLYGVYAPITYTVSYNCNNGSGTTANSTHYYGTPKTLTTNACTRSGYTFNGWNTAANGTGTSYSNQAEVTNLTSTNGGTTTLYAQWKASISVSVLNQNYLICPEDRNIPTRDKCLRNGFSSCRYNSLYINSVSTNGTSVTVNIRAHMNNDGTVTWAGSNNSRELCLANSSNTCVKSLYTFTIHQGWTSLGSDPINGNFQFDVNDLAAGDYKIIINGGTDGKFRFRDSSYVLNTIRITR